MTGLIPCGNRLAPALYIAERTMILVFSSLLFLFIYLPFVLAIYYILPAGPTKKCRNAFLFFSSLIFYAWGEPVYVFLMLFSTVFGWLAGVMLGRLKKSGGKAKVIISLYVLANIGFLCFFKYGGFIAENLSQIPGLRLAAHRLPLPLGISFYTFQTISYVIDVYRGDAAPQPNILDFGAYIAMFPQLIAGPIVRYHTIARQMETRRESLDLLGSGAGIFVAGLAKKVLLANNIGLFWDVIRDLPPGEMTVLAAWAGISAFGLQLYFDFSGYSDMAVGLGRMLGFRFTKNFFYPYCSKSITEFWRRWHISLGDWFREYLYIPLGGSRRGNWATVCNLLVVWAATGLWHGANWNFVLWGLYYYLFIAGEKFLWGRRLEKAPSGLRHLYILAVVITGWALFVYDDMDQLGCFLRAMAGFADGGWIDDRIRYLLNSWGILLTTAMIGATPLAALLLKQMGKKWPRTVSFLKPVLMLTGFLLSVSYLVDSSYNPFLYFRF